MAWASSRAVPSAKSSGVNSVDKTTTPAGPCAAAQPGLACNRTCTSSLSSVTGPSASSIVTCPSCSSSRKQFGGIGLGQGRFYGRQAFAQPGAEPFQVGQDRVADVLIGPLADTRPLSRSTLRPPAAGALPARPDAPRSARITSTLASGWRTLSLAAMRAARPCETISRTSRMRAESSASIAASVAGLGKSHRWTLSTHAAGKRGHGQILPHRLGQKRHERGHQLGRRQQAFVQRPIGVELVGAFACRRAQKRSRLRRTYQLLSASTNSVICWQAA